MKKRCIIFAILSILLFVASAFAADTYESLRKEYDGLSGIGKASRASLLSIGERFYRVYTVAPGAQNADYALLYAGKSYKLAYEISSENADMERALRHLRTVASVSRTSAAPEAHLEQAELYMSKNDLASAQFQLKRIKTQYPGSPQEVAADSIMLDLNRMAHRAENPMDTTFTIPPIVLNNTPQPFTPPAEPTDPVATATTESVPDEIAAIIGQPVVTEPVPSGITAVRGIRHFSDKDYTRIVIDMSQNAKIEPHWLNADPSINQPPRLFIDIFDSAVDSSVPPQTEIKDGLVKSVRWGYNRPGITRIVLDSEAIKDHTVFQLGSPARLVIDVSGSGNGTALAARPVNGAATATPAINHPTQPSGEDQTLASAFGLKIRTIVIDPGHGGKDPGAVYNSLKEKDIVLDIGKALRDMLKQKNKDLNVYMTRETDVFIPLEERTAIANKYKADIFVSIHVNAAKNTNASGAETYVLNVTKDAASLELAAFENSATTKSISDLQGILQDIMLSSKLQESLLLAKFSQDNLATAAKMKNLGVKQAPFYVLVGAKMPAVLVESGFLSNTADAKLLATKENRKKMAEGIYKGIDEYIKKYNK